MNKPTPLLIGKLGKPFALKGYITVISYTNPLSNLFNYQPWYIKGQSIEFEDYQSHQKRSMVKLPAIETPEQALLMKGQGIYIDHSLLQAPAANEYYWDDVIGLEAFGNQSGYLGKVNAIMPNPAQDILVISQHVKDQPVLVPFIDQYVLEIDMINQKITLEW